MHEGLPILSGAASELIHRTQDSGERLISAVSCRSALLFYGMICDRVITCRLFCRDYESEPHANPPRCDTLRLADTRASTYFSRGLTMCVRQVVAIESSFRRAIRPFGYALLMTLAVPASHPRPASPLCVPSAVLPNILFRREELL